MSCIVFINTLHILLIVYKIIVCNSVHFMPTTLYTIFVTTMLLKWHPYWACLTSALVQGGHCWGFLLLPHCLANGPLHRVDAWSGCCCNFIQVLKCRILSSTHQLDGFFGAPLLLLLFEALPTIMSRRGSGNGCSMAWSSEQEVECVCWRVLRLHHPHMPPAGSQL